MPVLYSYEDEAPILVADDDDDDRLLTLDAFRDSGSQREIHFVENGEQLLDYLHRRRQYAALTTRPLPSMVLLDLNMPVMDGREALREIRNERSLLDLPVIIFTTSKSPLDIHFTYELGASLYITKPSSYKYFVRTMHALLRLDVTHPPPTEGDYVFRISGT